MLTKITHLYKFSLLLAVFVIISILAFTVEKNPIQISFIILGALGGCFFLDLDYILHAYFLEPKSDFSQSLQSFIKHKDIKGLANYIYYHRNDLKEKTLNSAIFQLVLGGASILVTSSASSKFAQAFVISAFVNSMYRLAEQHLEYKNTDDWFWAFKNKPDKLGLLIYGFVLLAMLVTTFFFL